MKSLRQQITQALRDKPNSSTSVIATTLGFERNDIIREINHMMKEGLVSCVGENGNHVKVYSLVYSLDDLTEVKEPLTVTITHVCKAEKRPPFSPAGICGFKAKDDTVTLFLDRRITARSVTLPVAELKMIMDMAGRA